MDKTDILVAGGGIAGLSAAARLAADGQQVTIVDPAPAEPTTADRRTTAFLQPAIATLQTAGVWDAMAGHGTALRVMRIVDAGGQVRQVRETADFTAEPAGHEVFGWNVPNAPARTALLDHLDGQANVDLRLGVRATDYLGRIDQALVKLSDGARLSARLVLAADGRNSTLRALANLPVRRWEYGQHALVFTVTHDAPHDNISTEIHRTGGPLTLVPMPDQDGKPASAVVWMTPSARALGLNDLSDADLAAELTAQTMGLFGPLTVAGPRAVWPIITQVATRLTAPRLALIAEAAHVMPPIGAQGLNTSVHDIETIAALIHGQPDPGAPDLLDRYQSRILPRTLARIAGIDLLNRAARTEFQPLRDLRRAGLTALSRIPPLRALAVRAGMGTF